MRDNLADALGVRPLYEATQDKSTGEVITYDAETGEIQEDNFVSPSQEVAVHVTPVDEDIDPAILEAEEDFKTARTNINDALKVGEDMMALAKEIALSVQDEKTISAFAKMFDSYVKGNKTLMEMHRDRFILKPPVTAAPQQAETINNNNIIFTGSGTELMQLLRDKGLGKIESK